MKLSRTFTCIAAALLLLGTLCRPGVRIIVAGQVLPGTYAPAVAARCAADAHAAAEEICREEAVPDYRMIPVLCARWTPPQQLQLTRILLESYDGVQRVYTVRAGGETMGSVTELEEVSRLRMRFPGLPLTITPTYTHSQTHTDVHTVMAQLEDYAKNLTAPF